MQDGNDGEAADTGEEAETYNIGKSGDELRCPIKAKTFILVLVAGTLPQLVVAAYNDANTKRAQTNMETNGKPMSIQEIGSEGAQGGRWPSVSQPSDPLLQGGRRIVEVKF